MSEKHFQNRAEKREKAKLRKGKRKEKKIRKISCKKE
ncbi:MAG: hypothetical protein UR25_C0002G0056 [Candidatus Nomurabacteria bacterium GW2011_GWE1_32_28]|uniref:Uncharacterized protein n=1 Tax=Candidatus Nomurabacteria bacterium GW2011_GWF1_31_48 TaxID=1618767 RepID=A0A0G0AV30_9BACT|nr:MAG: hypothetical protein UR10_C0002G0056 [Candidatus Nomurabacteria bacterium GW2011_GWF2_30_133]KKP29055.1 MAG: hypothetical protein UR18_C0001G0176 [Candidatus Nomurabacteria bacterium GW2011_GWE2_31_40]KKP30535.1 MAG: hypothetical protein UR19_C0002G0056 [Candidatus Nomurabacteria bacterium GW2011_GWF1_31_48]KKP35020.1 MAG: hypothetical protein UR25_C0002G0056 [Candidatus Nomurabacteria bacterium GW2011_GWE1_32_28]